MSAGTEGVGYMNCTAARHQVAVEMFWPQSWEAPTDSCEIVRLTVCGEDGVTVGHWVFRWHGAAVNWILRAVDLKQRHKHNQYYDHLHVTFVNLHLNTSARLLRSYFLQIFLSKRSKVIRVLLSPVITQLQAFSLWIVPFAPVGRSWSRWEGLGLFHSKRRGHPCRCWRWETFGSVARWGGKAQNKIHNHNRRRITVVQHHVVSLKVLLLDHCSF